MVGEGVRAATLLPPVCTLPNTRRRDLFLVTFAILALELAVIRWMSQQVRLSGYLNDVLLISAFLGMGLGVRIGRRRPSLFQWTLPLLAALCAVLAFAGQLGIVHLPMPDDCSRSLRYTDGSCRM